MQANPALAVEITRGEDHLDIWVDANNNGERDDDDVNIYVTKNGGFYTVSPTFKHALDAAIQNRIKELAVAMLSGGAAADKHSEQTLSKLALELVVKAISPEEEKDLH